MEYEKVKVYESHFAVEKKLIQHCESAILQ